MKLSQKIIRFLIVLAGIAVMLVLLMFARSSTLMGAFVLEASEQWMVRQDRPGEFVARQTSGRREIMQSAEVYQFPNSDMIQLNLASNLTEGTVITAGTPVLELVSLSDQTMEKVLIARTNRLTIQINLLQKGEGTEKIAAAEASLALALTNLQSYSPLVDRRRGLVTRGVLSQDELQNAEDEYNRRQQQVIVAREDVDVRRMQVAPGVVSMAAAELEEAQQELHLVQTRRASRWLRSPVPGRLTRYSGVPNILMRVLNEWELSARVTVPMTFIDQLNVGDPVELIFAGIGIRSVTAAVERIELLPDPVYGQSVVNLLTTVPNKDGRLQVGLTGQAVIRGINANPWYAIWWRLRLAGIDALWSRRGQP